MPKKSGKPKGKITAYAAFVQICREEHKKKHPDEQLVFAEFSKKCAEKWKTMGPKEKKRFEDIAERDKQRYEKELAAMPIGQASPKKKNKKDPNAPKRPLSAFFFFCQEFRASIKKQNPSFGIGDISKQLGHQWEVIGDKSKYEMQASKDKARYEKEMAAYKSGIGSGAAAASAGKKTHAAPVHPANAAAEEEEEEDDDEEDDDDDDESD